MSKTEQDLDSSLDDEAVDELASDPETAESDVIDELDIDDIDADTAEVDAALDEALVGAIESYTAEVAPVETDDTDDVSDTAADDLVADADEDLDEFDEFDEDEFDADLENDQAYEMPEIVPATDDDDADDVEAHDRAGDRPEVSEDILEELRRADIDGPIVEMAPQDDTTSARRRPKRAIDYDPAPVPIPLRVPRILGRKPRVRKVTRVVRHVDPWSVFKIAIIADMVLYIIVLTAGVLLWNVAYVTGTVSNVERFFESFGWQSFEFNGGEIYHGAWIAGLFMAIGLTGLAVLLATLFNLITDLVGGVRFTVLEEEVVESRTSPMRRFVVRRPEPVIPSVVSDNSGSFIREAVVDDTGGTPR